MLPWDLDFASVGPCTGNSASDCGWGVREVTVKLTVVMVVEILKVTILTVTLAESDGDLMWKHL